MRAVMAAMIAEPLLIIWSFLNGLVSYYHNRILEFQYRNGENTTIQATPLLNIGCFLYFLPFDDAADLLWLRQ